MIVIGNLLRVVIKGQKLFLSKIYFEDKSKSFLPGIILINLDFEHKLAHTCHVLLSIEN